ncbi:MULTISPECIES: restriction endonuclease subunit S [unclassified Bifidobacterium]|uniref:restriction endonuclease subunit S n=1 Tax=unclassified Bifidobacterium TaxID=2608897 RepID=UPI00112B7DF1|nr:MULTISPECIES: restriction endonuclease subunit S [unclassified Bifidobacterium]
MTDMVKLGDVLRPWKDMVQVKDTRSVPLISVKLYGQGAVRREIGDGKAPKPFTGNRGRAGQFVFSRIWARRGAMALLPSSLDGVVVTNEFPLFDIDQNRLEPRYLSYLVQTKAFLDELERVSAGASGQNRVKESAFLNIAVQLPPLDEQRRIVAILDRVDAIRAKRRRMLADFDELKGSVYLDMFNDDDIERRSFGELFNVRSGQFLPAKSQHDGPYAVYGGNGINGRHDRYTLEKPEIVIGRVGANCGAVHITEPKSWVTDNALVLSQIHDDYDMTCLAMILDKAKLNQYAAKSGQPSISMNRISTVMIPLPPISLQREFARRVEAIAAARAKVERALALDDELFVSLQSRAFRGEL